MQNSGAMTKESTLPDAAEPLPLDAFCPPEMRESVAVLTPMLYADLKKVARSQRRQLFSPQTMTTTSLVHDAFVKLSTHSGFESHAHFLRVAAVTMRHLLIDRVRAQMTAKRGGGMERVDLDEAVDLQVENGETVLAIHNALGKLAQFAPRLAEVVQCRFFAGYEEKEIAEALGVTERTIRRDWVSARAWLARELGDALSVQAMGPRATG